MTERPHGGRGGALVWVLLVAILVPLVPFAVIGELPGERWLEATGSTALRFGLVGAGLLALDVLLPIPSSLIGSLLGGRLGLLAGFAWAMAGLSAGTLIGYGLGRLLPKRWASERLERPTSWVVFLSRPVPVLAEAAAVAAGAERVPLLPFSLAAGLGNACYAGAMAANGAALMPEGLAGPGLALPMAVPALAWWLWRVARKRAARDGTSR